MTTTNSLHELTGHEAGLIVYEDEVALICNWCRVDGLPRLDPMGITVMGFGEKFSLSTKSKKVPVKKVLARLVDNADGEADWNIIYAPNFEDDIKAIAEAAELGEKCEVWNIKDGEKTVQVFTFEGWN